MVGEEDAVAAELVVAGRLATVAAVAEVRTAVPVGQADGLVGEVPDEATLEQRLAVGEIEVPVDGAERVAHRVGVLAEDERLVPVGGEERLDLGRRRVHAADDVARLGIAVVPVHALVVDRSVVDLTEVVRDREDVLPAERLVAARPHDDAGVVLVPLHHARGPVEQGRQPLGPVAGHRLVDREPAAVHGVPQAVGLEVHLVDDVQAVLVAQVVEEGVVRVVAGAHGVDAGGLHQPDVRLRLLPAHDAPVEAELVPVDTLEHDAPAVDLQQPVLDAEPADADAQRDDLGERALGVPQLQRQGVPERVLRAPQPRGGHAHDELAVARLGQLPDPLERSPHAPAPCERDLDRDDRLGQVVGHRGPDPHVLGVDRGTPVQHHVAEQAREAVEVLVLDPRAAGPLDHLRGELVLARHEGVGQVELRRREGVARVPDVDAVVPHRDGALGALERHAQPLPRRQRPVRRVRPHVARHGVVALRHLARLDGLVPVPRVLDVGVLGAVERLEALDPLAGVLRVVELPHARQRLLVPADPRGGLVGVAEPAVVGMGGQAVLGEVLRVRDPADVECHVMAPACLDLEPNPTVGASRERSPTTSTGASTMGVDVNIGGIADALSTRRGRR